MHDVAITKECMDRAEKGVHQSLQVLRANGGQADQAHPVVRCLRGTEIGAAVHGDVVSHLGQALANLLVVWVSRPLYLEITPRPPMNATRNAGFATDLRLRSSIFFGFVASCSYKRVRAA